jgi:hypothetical protein
LNIKLVTLFDAAFAEIGSLSLVAMERYCAHKGYAIHAYRHLPDPSRSPQWNKIRVCQQELATCDWLLWMDADAMPVNLNFKVELLIESCQGKDFIISRDENEVCTGIFLVRNCEWSVRFLETVWLCGQMDYEYAKKYHPAPNHERDTFIALGNNFPDILKHFILFPKNSVCNPRSEFNPKAFAVHYWASDLWERKRIAERITIFLRHGWCKEAHKSSREDFVRGVKAHIKNIHQLYRQPDFTAKEQLIRQEVTTLESLLDSFHKL